jgi:hypothetical protein
MPGSHDVQVTIYILVSVRDTGFQDQTRVTSYYHVLLTRFFMCCLRLFTHRFPTHMLGHVGLFD